MSTSALRALARRIDVLERDRKQRKQPNLGFSTIDGGAIQAQDDYENLKMVIGQQYDGTNAAAVVSGPTPPTPTVPLVTEQAGALRIYWDGTFADGAVAPMDFARVLVYAEPVLTYNGPEPLNQTLIVGGFSSATGGEITAALDPGVEYVVYLVCWSVAGKYSAASSADLGIPALEAVPATKPISPTVMAIGMPDSFVLRSGQIAGTTSLQYQVSPDGGATWLNVGGPTASEVLVAKTYGPSNTPFALEVSYLFRSIADNAATGSTPAPSAPSAPVRLDTSKIALVASQLITEEVIAGFALLGVVNIGGSSFTLSKPGSFPDDPERNKGGLRIELTNGGLIHFPADGSAPQLTGISKIEVENLYVTGLTVRGASELGGQIEIGAGVKDPTEPPVVEKDYYSIVPQEVSLSNIQGLCRNMANDGWLFVAVSENVIYNMSDSGVVTHAWAPEDNPDVLVDKIYSVTKVGTSYFVSALVYTSGSGGSGSSVHGVVRFGAAWNQIATFQLSDWSRTDPVIPIGAANNGAEFIIAVPSGSNTILRRYDIYGSFVTQVSLGSVTNTIGIYHGDGDFGATRYVLQQVSADPKVYNVNVLVPGESWPRATATQARGLWWDGTYFWTVDSAGRVRRYETAASAPADVYGFAYDWRDADTHYTSVSPTVLFARPKRARIKVTASPAPRQGAIGSHIPNLIQIFASTMSINSTLHVQGPPLEYSWSATLTSIGTAGVSNGPSNWSTAPEANPGEIFAESGGWWVDGNSDGDVGDGSFRDSIAAALSGWFRRGTKVMASSPANTTTSIPIVFDPPMEAVPTITCTPSVNVPGTAVAWATTITVDGFYLNFVRTTTADTVVQWSANAIGPSLT